LLIEAVRLRLQADVPIGALLSAGVDSSLVCWALARLNTNVRTYSVGTPGDEADETAEAAKTARRLGIPHEVVDLGDSGDANILDEAVAAYGEPFGCTSALGMLQVSRMIRERAKVVLTGDGGDDVFLGYPFQRRIWTAQRLAQRIPEGAAAIWQRFRPANGSRTFKRVRNLLDYATGGLGAVTRVHDGLPYFWQRGMLGERLAGRKLAQREIPLSMASARRVLTDVLHYEQTMTFAGEFMTKVDGATMHYSLEARSPLLDHVLWDFAATLPYEVRFHCGQLKAVLRELLRRHVSPELASRAKSGFTIPVGRWLVGRWRAQLEWLRNDPLVERDGWLAKGAATRAIAESEHKQMAPLQLWHVLALERWLRRQNGKSSCERL
jgi:asparagine synthase (glutamine-hydrolysing)